jgi:hypothetical protein
MARDSFTERMEQGKLLAQVARNKGLATGKSAKGWSYQRAKLDGLDMLENYLYTFRKDVHYNAYAAVEFALFSHEWEGL